MRTKEHRLEDLTRLLDIKEDLDEQWTPERQEYVLACIEDAREAALELVKQWEKEGRQHECVWETWSYTLGPNPMIRESVHERCTVCQSDRSRPATEKEVATGKLELDWNPGFHAVWHQFCELAGWRGDGDHSRKVEREKVLEAAERLQREFPAHIRTVGVDDFYHASSSLILVSHFDETQYWGTSVVYVPQCAPGPVVEFFLYPGHALDLQKALSEIISLAEKYPDPYERAVEEYDAKQARLVPCKSCDGQGYAVGEDSVRHNCTACEGDGTIDPEEEKP